MSVSLSVLSMRCQHFQNVKAPRPLGRSRWNLASIFCGSGDKTYSKWNFEFWPLWHVEPPLWHVEPPLWHVEPPLWHVEMTDRDYGTYDVVFVMCQVHHQVLADQRETLLDHIIASISSNRQTLENAVSTKDLDKLWSRINGVCSHAYCIC